MIRYPLTCIQPYLILSVNIIINIKYIIPYHIL